MRTRLWEAFRRNPRSNFVPSCSCSCSKRPLVSPRSLTENPPAIASQFERFRLDRVLGLRPVLHGIGSQFNPNVTAPVFQAQRDVL